MDKIKDVIVKFKPPQSSREIVPSRKTARWMGDCIPNCPVCEGIGFIRYMVPITDPRFGKLEPCPNRDKFEAYGRGSGIEEEEKTLSWDDVKDFGDALTAVYAVKAVLEQGYGWVYLWGGYGQAKTLIQKIAVVQSILKSNPASYVRMAELIDNLRQSFDAKDAFAEGERRLEFWSSIPVLCIDEFDRVRGTEYAEERRFVLMDKRYEEAIRHKSVTILTSNEDPAKLDGYLFDRIKDGRFLVVHLGGKSARPSMSY